MKKNLLHLFYTHIGFSTRKKNCVKTFLDFRGISKVNTFYLAGVEIFVNQCEWICSYPNPITLIIIWECSLFLENTRVC